jgi:RHS repeat-associated protein
VTQKLLYYPWGQTWQSAGTVKDNRFASLGQRDAETGNDPTLFRLYNPRLYRWLSPDPLAGSILNPQSLNRYAYVLNNPVNVIDPLGLDPPQGPPPHPGCGDNPTISCVWERYGWTIPGMFGAGLTCYVDGVKTPCDMTYGLVQSGAAYPLPPKGEGWEPVRRGAQPDCPGCFYNPQTDQTWDPDNPLSWGSSWNFSTLPPDARVVFSQVAKSTSTLTTGRFYLAWIALAATPGLAYSAPAIWESMSGAWLIVESAHPGATASAIDALQILSPTASAPTTWAGAAAAAYSAYTRLKKHYRQ